MTSRGVAALSTSLVTVSLYLSGRASYAPYRRATNSGCSRRNVSLMCPTLSLLTRSESFPRRTRSYRHPAFGRNRCEPLKVNLKLMKSRYPETRPKTVAVVTVSCDLGHRVLRRVGLSRG